MQDFDCDFDDADAENTNRRGNGNKRSRPKVSIKWNDDNIFKLITAVESYEELWDPSSQIYKNRTAKDSAWREIHENLFNSEIGLTELISKWNNIRIQFRSYRSKLSLKKSGSGTDDSPKWKFWNAMLFIDRMENQYSQATASNMVR